VPVNEIELELKHGDPASLFSFALQLHEQMPVRVSNTSKAERGYTLCRQTGTVPYRAKAAAAGRRRHRHPTRMQAVLGNCLQHIQRNENAVIEGDDAETLHQMRVGVRRLRSRAEAVRRRIAPCPPGAAGGHRLAGHAAGRGTRLGRAADLHAGAGCRRRPGGQQAACWTCRRWRSTPRARRASERCRRLLSARYSRLLLALGLWMQQLASEPNLASARRQILAQWTIQRLHQQLLKRAKRMDDSDATTIHRTRIAAKRARYALEFFHTAISRQGCVRDVPESPVDAAG
jgi:triphosphatase